MAVSFGIEFELARHSNLIDGIIQSRGMYLQTGKPGDKISDLNPNNLLLEVPEVGFDKKWDSLLFEFLKVKYKKKGVAKKDLSQIARKHIHSTRELRNVRHRNNNIEPD
jgi:hypothetical protein